MNINRTPYQNLTRSYQLVLQAKRDQVAKEHAPATFYARLRLARKEIRRQNRNRRLAKARVRFLNLRSKFIK